MEGQTGRGKTGTESRKKHGVEGAGKGEGKEGIWDTFTELLK